MTIAPWFRCRVMTYEKEKEFGFTYKEHGVEVIPDMCIYIDSDWGERW